MESLPSIRKRRLALGIPLGELARAVGRSDGTISRIERGQIRPSYDLVQRILRYLEEREGVAAPALRASDLQHAPVVFVDGASGVGEASRRLEHQGFSQAPVTDGGRVTGSVSEAVLLRALAHPTERRARVREIQEAAYPQVDRQFPAELLAPLLTRCGAVLVASRGEIEGIVTKTDLIRGLRGMPLRRPAPAAEPSHRG